MHASGRACACRHGTGLQCFCCRVGDDDMINGCSSSRPPAEFIRLREKMTHSVALDTVAASLWRERDNILSRWRDDVAASGNASTVKTLSRTEFYDHIPQFIERFCALLRGDGQAGKAPAKQHGAHRWQQGLDFEEVILEWKVLHHILFERLTALWRTSGLDLESLQHVYWLLADTVQKAISASLTEFHAHQRLAAEARMRDLEAVLEEQHNLDLRRGHGLHQASHDLRGSLQVIRLSCHALQRRPHDEQTGAVVERLVRAIDGLSQLFNDMRDLARLEAGREACENSDFDAAAMLREMCETMQPVAEARGLSLRVDGIDSLPVNSDAAKLRRIAQNLILNALSYTAAGNVAVGWQAESRTHWSFYVRDSGPGLPASSADAPLAAGLESAQTGANASPAPAGNAFTVSRYAENSGEGIGLSIVHRLCQLLDAVLEIDSKGNGTTFRIRLRR